MEVSIDYGGFFTANVGLSALDTGLTVSGTFYLSFIPKKLNLPSGQGKDMQL